ncbi:MAG: molybdenum cofactor guanylyltransferase [Chloroflexota bacterium]
MVTVAIQAGGRSRRMGRDKGLVPLAGKPLIQHLLDRVAGLGDEILVTTNRPDDYAFLGVRLASDPVPGAGALAGLHTALEAARGQTVIVLACDMPFVSRPLLEHLLKLARQGEAQVVVPRRGREYEPLHAVYARACLAAIEAAQAAGEGRMISFFSRVRVAAVEEDELVRYDPEGLSFFNVNTPEDLAQAERILAEGRA